MAKQDLPQRKITGYLSRIVGANCGEKIPLYDFDIVIGRSKTAYICSPDPNVSRNHCSLKFGLTGWLIKDLGSVNGTYINDCRIETDTYVPVTDGCSIYFGPSDDAPEGYKFEIVETSKEVSNEGELPRRSTRASPQKTVNNRPVKRKVSIKGGESSESSAIPNNSWRFTENVEADYHSDSSISSLDSLKTRIRKANSSMKKRKKSKLFDNVEKLVHPSTSKKADVPKSEDEYSISLLDQENITDEGNTDNCNNHDESWRSKIEHRSNLIPQVTLNSSNVLVQQELLKVLQKKVDDLQQNRKKMNSQYADIMNENTKLSEYLKSQEIYHKKNLSDMREDFRKLLEEEMICNICTELFIKPITLGCSHTFCRHCIFEWKKKKKQCPMCREKIESETSILFLDNFINKAVEQLDPSSLEKRLELAKIREQLENVKTKGKKGKGRNRRTNQQIPEIGDNEVELLRSRISEIQSYTDDIQTYVDVIDELINEREDTRRRCYNCGRAGHWADGCPY